LDICRPGSSTDKHSGNRLIRNQDPSRERITDAFFRSYSSIRIPISQLRQQVVIGHHQVMPELMEHREVLTPTSRRGDIADGLLIVEIRTIARTHIGGVAARHLTDT
jgi:hypothetical protein